MYVIQKVCLHFLFKSRFVVGMAYYGLMLNSGNLGDSIFLSYTLNVIADFPAPIATQILINRTGRRPYLIACMVICGLSCLSTVFSLQYGGPGQLANIFLFSTWK